MRNKRSCLREPEGPDHQEKNNLQMQMSADGLQSNLADGFLSAADAQTADSEKGLINLEHLWK